MRRAGGASISPRAGGLALASPKAVRLTSQQAVASRLVENRPADALMTSRRVSVLRAGARLTSTRAGGLILGPQAGGLILGPQAGGLILGPQAGGLQVADPLVAANRLVANRPVGGVAKPCGLSAGG